MDNTVYDAVPRQMGGGMALAMQYVPVQQWEEPYDEETALSRGTIFPALDKPFLGEEGCPK